MPDTAEEWTSLAPKGEFLCLPAETGNIMCVESAIVAQCPARDLSDKNLLHLRLLVDEIFSNICRHAYNAHGGEMAVYVEKYNSREKILCFWAVDWGAPFDPIAMIPAASPVGADFELAEERPLRKLGLYLVGQTSHKLDYKRALFSFGEAPVREANLLRVTLALAG